ncbi:MAG: IS3 family transposase, partial [Lachnospiraceae bacterium]|nr:IS3 family transposase [Lachnospiraceae bacterium]
TAIYIEVAEKVEASKVTKRRVSVSGMLKKLGVSRSGYRAFLNHKPSAAQQRKDSIKSTPM